MVIISTSTFYKRGYNITHTAKIKKKKQVLKKLNSIETLLTFLKYKTLYITIYQQLYNLMYVV